MIRHRCITLKVLASVALIGSVLSVTVPTAAFCESRSNLSISQAELLIRRGDYERAIDKLFDVETTAVQPGERVGAALTSAKLYDAVGKTDTSIRLLEEFVERETDLSTAHFDLVKSVQSKLMLKQGYLREAQFNLGLIKDREAEKQALMGIAKGEGRSSFENDEHSGLYPVYYGISSAIVPGSGQALLGRPLDGVTAVIMIAAPLYLHVKAKQNDERAFAAASGFVAGLFYLGNIVSAYRLASNDEERRAKERWLALIDGVQIDFSIISGSISVMLQKSFDM